MRRLVVVASRNIEYDLRNRLYAHLQRLSGASTIASRPAT